MKKKSFDCVEMKRQGAERVRKKIQKMTPEEEIEFWRNRTEALREKQRRQRSSDMKTKSGKTY